MVLNDSAEMVDVYKQVFHNYYETYEQDEEVS